MHGNTVNVVELHAPDENKYTTYELLLLPEKLFFFVFSLQWLNLNTRSKTDNEGFYVVLPPKCV